MGRASILVIAPFGGSMLFAGFFVYLGLKATSKVQHHMGSNIVKLAVT